MNSRSPFQTSPPSKALSRLTPPTNRSPSKIKPKPSTRLLEIVSRSTNQANKVVHKGKLPGIRTEACAAGAKKKPL